MWRRLRSLWNGAGEQGEWRELLDRLATVESELRRLSDKKPDVRIHVEKLEVQRAVLESLTFRLDKLEIDELSGALNLGNNFAAPPEQYAAKDKAINTFERADSRADSAPAAAKGGSRSGNWERTPTGYSCKFGESLSRPPIVPKTRIE